MSSTVAVVLAGGNGKRMDILCHVRPKPALPFAGRFKVIDFSLSNCIYSKITNIAVLTDYQRSYMADYLSQWRLMNANSTNFRVLEPKAGSYCGTADAVYQNLDYFDKNKVDAVLVLAGDHVYKLDYRKMLAFHRDVTVLGKGVIVPPRTAIGRNCKIMPHVGSSDFITNVVTPGVVISRRSMTSFQIKKAAISGS